MEKIKNLILLFLSILLINIGILTLDFTNIKINKSTNEKNISSENDDDIKYVIPMSDILDKNPDVSFDEFFSRKNIIEDMEEINHKLNNNDFFEYYQVSGPSIQYIGNYKGAKETALGDINVKEEETNKRLTSLNSMEIPKRLNYQLQEQIESGRSFEEADYKCNTKEIIPVVLGSYFKDSFKVGDHMKLKFFLTEVEVKVVGILEKQSMISLSNISIDVSDQVLFPTVNINKNDKAIPRDNNIIMLLEKNESYIGFRNKEDLPYIVKFLKDINSKYDFIYDVAAFEENAQKRISNYEENNMVEQHQEISNNISSFAQNSLRACIVIGMILFFVATYFMSKIITVTVNCKRVLLKTKISITYLLQIVICYFIGYLITNMILGKIWVNFNTLFMLNSNGKVRLLIAIISIFGIIYLCKSTRRDE